MKEEEFFNEQINLVNETLRNKRRGRDAVSYQADFIALTIRAMDARFDKTLRIERNYAFLVSLPRWREIMATCTEGRKIDHEICRVVIPLANNILSQYTFNNRKGFGAQAAINTLIEHIFEVSEGYTKPCRVIKLDFKGYFPNALWDYAEKVVCDVIDTADLDQERKSYLKWLTMIAIQCNPAEHCELRTPKHFWKEHIPEEKSILSKPEGIGAAIGRLIWQTAMGLYINDIILWLTNDCGIKLICFVDDIVMVVPEYLHQYALSLIPELRKRLAGRNVYLNEKKFYDQPFQNGLEFLGSHIKPNRIHLNNITYGRAIERIKQFNGQSYKDIDAMVLSANSYIGLLKTRTDHKRLLEFIAMIDESWWSYLEWNNKKQCIAYKEEFSVNYRLNQKYKLNLKIYDQRRKKRATQRTVFKEKHAVWTAAK